MRSSSTPETPGAHPDDVAALTRAVATIDGGAIIVTADDPLVAADVATAVATHDASFVWARRGDRSDQALADVHVAAPAAVSWTVGDVERAIVTPATRRPIHRMHLIVVNAHQMAPLAADRLLKIVEEPRTDVIFWFAAPTPDALPVTLVSRAARVVRVRPLPPTQRHQALISAGADDLAATEILNLAGADARLALAVVTANALAALRTFARYPHALLDRSATLDGAEDLVVAIATLCDALTATRRRVAPDGARTAWSKLDPVGRAHGRALTLTLIDRVSDQAAARVADADTRATLEHLETALHACEQARQEVRTNAHPVTVLGALTARVSGS